MRVSVHQYINKYQSVLILVPILILNIARDQYSVPKFRACGATAPSLSLSGSVISAQEGKSEARRAKSESTGRRGIATWQLTWRLLNRRQLWALSFSAAGLRLFLLYYRESARKEKARAQSGHGQAGCRLQASPSEPGVCGCIYLGYPGEDHSLSLDETPDRCSDLRCEVAI